MTQPANINLATTKTTGRTEPAAFAGELNAIINAFLSLHGGAARPAYAVAGLIWTDTDTGEVFLFDGASDLLASVGGLRSQNHGELTIATGVVTTTGPGTFSVDTEADAASDDLDTITATNMSDGDVVILKAADSTRTVVIKNGTGNINCGADVTLDNALDRAMLQWDSAATAWVLLASNSNGA